MGIKNKTIEYSPEIILGLVAGVGTDLKKVIQEFKIKISPTKYTVVDIHVSDFVNKKLSNHQDKYKVSIINERIKKCNEFRKKSSRPDAMALLAIAKIYHKRKTAAKKMIYIINQLKRPEEIKTLRKVYGKNFIVISVYESNEKRKSLLKKYNKNSDDKIDLLMKTDTNQEEGTIGQKTEDTFSDADYFIEMEMLEKSIRRFTDILFGFVYHTPTKVELNMCYAWSAALRSADLSRQVGAVLTNEEGDIIATGCNDIPKAMGGMFWEGDHPDLRDFQLQQEPNDYWKEDLIKELIKKACNLTDEKEILAKYEKLNKKPRPRIFDITEFQRAVHGEIAAICDAARRGIAVKDAILYCTTFPCHLCTKHIIAAGIKKVIYIHPYPKSKAGELFENIVSIRPHRTTAHGKVIFEPFMGVAPRRMTKVYSFPPDTRKEEKGRSKQWNLLNKNPYHLSNRTPLSDYDKELAYVYWLSKAHLTSLIEDPNIKSVIGKRVIWNNQKKLTWAIIETAEHNAKVKKTIKRSRKK